MCNYTQESTHTRQSEPRSRTCNPIVDFVWLALSTILKHGSSGPRDSCKKCMLTVQLAAHKHQDSKNPMRRKQPLLFRWVEVPDFVYHCCAAAQQFFTTGMKRQRDDVRWVTVLWHVSARQWGSGEEEVPLCFGTVQNAQLNPLVDGLEEKLRWNLWRITLTTLHAIYRCCWVGLFSPERTCLRQLPKHEKIHPLLPLPAEDFRKCAWKHTLLEVNLCWCHKGASKIHILSIQRAKCGVSWRPTVYY